MGKSKLTDEQKEEVKRMYATGNYSIRALGRYFNITHNSIKYILFPETRKQLKEYHKQHWINNKEKLSKQHKDYYENNKEFVKSIHKEYNLKHEKEIKEWQRKYDRENKCFSIYIKANEVQLIENYFLAKEDDFIGWVIHHRLETHNSDGVIRDIEITPEELKALNMYYNRPADEIIFLKRNKHREIHNYVMNKHKNKKNRGVNGIKKCFYAFTELMP